jgi:hypothetical protein
METNNRILSFEEICATKDRETRDEFVPEWGGSVRFQSMSGEQRDKYMQLLQSRLVGSGDNRRLSSYEKIPAMLLQMVLIKADGSQLFDRKQIEQFQAKNGAVINRLVAIAQEMNGLSDAEVAKQAKNSETTPSEDAGSE